MRRVLVVLVIVLAAANVWLLLNRGADNQPDEPPALPFITTSAPEASDYVGSQACRECHAREFDLWAASHHANVEDARTHEPAPGEIAVGSRWMQAYAVPDERGYHRFRPRCWNLRDGGWLSVTDVLTEIAGPRREPGSIDAAMLAGRSFDLDCSGCHSSGAHVRLDLERAGLASTWRAIACDCEACHGPGRTHVEAEDPRGTLPRLEQLSGRTSTGLCARCHGGPPAVGDYTPADAEHHIGILGHRNGTHANGAASGQIYQHAAFLSSPCHAKGGLTCTSCHEPHGVPARDPYELDKLCLQCHEAIDPATHTHHDPLGTGAPCIACHMPQLQKGLLRHERDHRIGIPLPAARGVPDACTACHADKDKAWADRAWRRWWGEPPRSLLDEIAAVQTLRSGQGADPHLLRRLGTSRDPFFRAVAATVGGNLAAFLHDPLPEVRWAAVQSARGPGRADALRRALSDAHPVVRAAAWLALDKERPPLTPALRADLAIAVRQHRAIAPIRRVLGQLALEAGQPEEAVRQLEQALVFAPQDIVTWRDLAAAYEALGRTQEASVARKRVDSMRGPRGN